MLKAARIVLSSTPLVAVPTLAADGHLQTGITSVGPAKFMFTIAAALLLTLIFRSTASHLAQFINAKIGQWRIKAELAIA